MDGAIWTMGWSGRVGGCADADHAQLTHPHLFAAQMHLRATLCLAFILGGAYLIFCGVLAACRGVFLPKAAAAARPASAGAAA